MPSGVYKHKLHSEETRKKMSEKRKGKKPNLGHHHSEETKKKMSNSHKGINTWMRGKKHSEKTKKKLSLMFKGKSFSGKKCDWIGRKHSKETKKKMREARLGKKMPIEVREKISKTNKKRRKQCNFWKGGITAENFKIRHSFKNKKWRTLVFERDDYTCQNCGVRSGNGRKIYLEAHHIKSWANFPELRFEINNGLTLCKECHKSTDNYGSKCQQTCEVLL